MKRIVPWFITLTAVLWVTTALRHRDSPREEYDLESFVQIPVLVGGRVKPLDTVARNSLLIMGGKQTVRLPAGGSLSADRWIADVLFFASQADRHPVFAIHNQEIIGMFGWPQADKRYCSYEELRPHITTIEEEGQTAASIGASQRTPFQTAVHNLRNALALYQSLKNSIQPEGSVHFLGEIHAYAESVSDKATTPKMDKVGIPVEQTLKMRAFEARYGDLANRTHIQSVMPQEQGRIEGWTTSGKALLDATSPEALPASLKAFAALGDSYRAGDHAAFNQILAEYLVWTREKQPDWVNRSIYETFFNRFAPFYRSMILYLGAFLIACTSWMILPNQLRKTAFILLLLALLIHSFGMFSRMWMQGRPPVTNLYSSAIFVGWGAVSIGILLEWIFRDGIGAACSGLLGFTTLVIAHHLGSSGDTLEMMQAVLDSNLWLATHVVVITAGYSAMFLAGILAAAYITLGVFTRFLTHEREQTLHRMVYGVVCFATLFSFVGTVLGGIWADQSWGRFWGWDPKENGALLIVIWCALILHARWGGFIRQRGMMTMAVFGNVITAFSWFGVNMLGIGLHSYGFMDKTFPWLLGFVVSQTLLVLLSSLPCKHWRSMKSRLPGAAPWEEGTLASLSASSKSVNQH